MAKGSRDTFIVQGFRPKGRGLEAEQPREARDEPHALSLGERLAKSKAGVVVLRRSGDTELGDFEEPVVLATYGQVPLIFRDLPF
ncbi:hypothetical protein [Methylobacterium iners]|uniref:Uncharacterized protein n=1 Tax=Methylobacterium iners TaxID=418707 RepID=A0ABQ4RRK0_9HYPH|nr:hypothetical protein [Methylobacterium iners]GJD93406.1 hypothetical protein OCOJLMKI_0600 [Methylobacterium iners]